MGEAAGGALAVAGAPEPGSEASGMGAGAEVGGVEPAGAASVGGGADGSGDGGLSCASRNGLAERMTRSETNRRMAADESRLRMGCNTWFAIGGAGERESEEREQGSEGRGGSVMGGGREDGVVRLYSGKRPARRSGPTGAAAPRERRKSPMRDFEAGEVATDKVRKQAPTPALRWAESLNGGRICNFSGRGGF